MQIRPNIILPISIVLIVGVTLLFKFVFNSAEVDLGKQNNLIKLESGRDIVISATVKDSVSMGEPFEYAIRVTYKPDRVNPNFQKLLRSVRFLPFEQVHRTRTEITETEISPGISEYLLSYSLVGINVLPGRSYTLDPILLEYEDIGTNEFGQIHIQSASIHIAAFYSDRDLLEIPFRPVKGFVDDPSSRRQKYIVLGLFGFLLAGSFSFWRVFKRSNPAVNLLVDKLIQSYAGIRAKAFRNKEKVIEYEKIILSLFRRYGNESALEFWGRKSNHHSEFWQRSASKVITGFEQGYSPNEPDDENVRLIESEFENICRHIEPVCAAERLKMLQDVNESLGARMARQRPLLIGGIFFAACAAGMLIVLLNRGLWTDHDARSFNNWISNFPERMFDEAKDEMLNAIDLQMIFQLSEKQRVIENLERDELRSAYLYNYGTWISKAQKNKLVNPGDFEEEEDEAADLPTFDFPLALLANSARFYPYDEDTRRNLELVTLYRENQKKDEESGEVDGDIGPPVPGFSRDIAESAF